MLIGPLKMQKREKYLLGEERKYHTNSENKRQKIKERYHNKDESIRQ